MKRVLYLVVAALATTVVIAPFAAAQGENMQQVQERLQQAQDKVQEAQQYMQSPEGQQALEDARASLQEGLQQAQQGAQDRVQEKRQEVTSNNEVTSNIERTALIKSGGVALSEPALWLPAAALLMGGGILGYAILRRRR